MVRDVRPRCALTHRDSHASALVDPAALLPCCRRTNANRRRAFAPCHTVIGPFEEKYDECQRDVVKMAEYGKSVYLKSFQKLIDEFGFHPAFKRWFDDF